jgi:glycerol uptake facilitator protein
MAVFQSHGYYFWVPLVAPLVGGVAGGLIYDRAVRCFLPPVSEKPFDPGPDKKA